MAALQTPVCNFNFNAPDFNLPDVDGKHHKLADLRGPRGLLVMFICNHCPYVKAVQTRLMRDVLALQQHGIGSVAIMSNDAAKNPDDSPENMRRIAQQFGYPFPYLIDATQSVAQAYGAICTPDFFGFNADLNLQYRGRLDASGRNADADSPRELFNAMVQISKTGFGPREQTPSIGCSIKWK